MVIEYGKCPGHTYIYPSLLDRKRSGIPPQHLAEKQQVLVLYLPYNLYEENKITTYYCWYLRNGQCPDPQARTR